ncbi:MAG TPA: hypothetical protein EYN86_04975 [Planctomycetes bacterium]|nr:hypothetical protein [Planctomycetota bacterium]
MSTFQKRLFLVCLITIGLVAFFSFVSLNQHTANNLQSPTVQTEFAPAKLETTHPDAAERSDFIEVVANQQPLTEWIFVHSGNDGADLPIVEVLNMNGEQRSIVNFEASGESSASLMLPFHEFELKISDGWTSLPKSISTKDQSRLIRLLPVRRHSFVFMAAGPISGAEISLISSHGEVSFFGTSSSAGAVSVLIAAGHSFSIALKSNDLISLWHFPEGVKPSSTETVLHVRDVLPYKELFFIDSSTSMAIPKVKLMLSGKVCIAESRSLEYALVVAPRTKNLEVVTAVADGYIPKVISLEECAEKIFLEPLRALRIVVKTSEGLPCQNAKIRVYENCDRLALHTPKFLEEYQTDDEGACLVEVPLDSPFGVIGYHPKWGSNTMVLSHAESKASTLPLVLTNRSPLEIFVHEGAKLSPLLAHIEDIFGNKLEVRGTEFNTIAIADASLVKKIDIRSPEGHHRLIRRSRSSRALGAILDSAVGAEVSETLSVGLEGAFDLRGQVVDEKGVPVAGYPVSMRLDRHMFSSSNLESYPKAEGHLPTISEDWLIDYSPQSYCAVSDAAGFFELKNLLIGDYLIESWLPHLNNSTYLFGLDPIKTIYSLPLNEDLVIVIPTVSFLDIVVVDSKTGQQVANSFLEVAYPDFNHSGRVLRQKFSAASIRKRVGLAAGSVSRIVAYGYRPFVLPDELSMIKEVSMQPILPMRMRARSSSVGKAKLLFLRPFSLTAEHEVIGSKEVVFLEEGSVVEFDAPFPGCLVQLLQGGQVVDECIFEPGLTVEL